ncbi:MAG TPA: hypothetical protein VGF75_06345, partial [Candidatus Saccharimonadales bacterium]
SAREQVQAVLDTIPDNKPPEAENAMPLGEPLHEDKAVPSENAKNGTEQAGNTTGLDPSLFSEVPGSNAPPVPPPIPLDLPGNTDQSSL